MPQDVYLVVFHAVALFTRAWIEIIVTTSSFASLFVALFTRAWIEIESNNIEATAGEVALFTRAWIEISSCKTMNNSFLSPSLRGRGLKLPQVRL